MACSNLDSYWGMRTNVCVRRDCRTPPPPRLYHGRRPLFHNLKGPGTGRGRDSYGIDVQPSPSWIRAQSRKQVDAVYERMPWEAGPGSSVELWSPVLQLELRFADG